MPWPGKVEVLGAVIGVSTPRQTAAAAAAANVRKRRVMQGAGEGGKEGERWKDRQTNRHRKTEKQRQESEK